MSVREWFFGPDTSAEDRAALRDVHKKLFFVIEKQQETLDRMVGARFDPPTVQRMPLVQPAGLQMPMAEDILSMDDEQFLEKP